MVTFLKSVMDLYKVGWVMGFGWLNLFIKFFMRNFRYVGEIFRKFWSRFFSERLKKEGFVFLRGDRVIFFEVLKL